MFPALADKGQVQISMWRPIAFFVKVWPVNLREIKSFCEDSCSSESGTREGIFEGKLKCKAKETWITKQIM